MSGRIFITGDKHRTFVPLFWLAEKETLHPSDIMIIAGDAGYVWDKDYVYDMESLQQVFPGTIAFVDGNHENHALLNEFPVADVNANVVGSAASAGAEEDQVAALQFVTIDRTRIAQVVHFISRTRDVNFDQVLIGVINQSAAVKAGTWRGAAPAIGFTQLAHQFVHGGTLRFLHPDFMGVGDR